jgi:DNA invertase Pin-like site-specific DNA recombinase
MILGYIRVSTADQAQDDRTSLPEQENVIYGYAMTQGIDRFGVQIYSDAGVSARTPLKFRPKGEELLKDAQPGDTIIASKMDRIFRSARDALETVDHCKSVGIKLVLFDMGIQPVTDEGMSRMFFTMLAAFAEFERARIRERMIQGKAAKVKKGGHIGGEPPYGYQVVGEGRSAVLQEHPGEQEVINAIRDKVHFQFFSNPGMARELNERGLRNRTGKPFAAYQVQRIAERLTAN